MGTVDGSGPGDVARVVTGDLYTYAQAVMAMYVDGIGENARTTLNLGQLAQPALMPLPGRTTSTFQVLAGRFRGAALVAAQQASARAQFEQALRDLSNGLFAIGSAATVIANAYEGTEAASAASMSDVLYAFAYPDAPRPAGLPDAIDGHTLQGAESPGGSVPQALVAPDADADAVETVGSTVPGVPLASTRMVFADGSVREVRRAGGPGANAGEWENTTVTTYRASADGPVLGERTETVVTRQGALVSSVVTSGGITTTTTVKDGVVEVVVTHPEADGSQAERYVSSADPVEPRLDPRPSLVPGPLEVAKQEQLERPTG
jgi:hypothetical protein